MARWVDECGRKYRWNKSGTRQINHIFTAASWKKNTWHERRWKNSFSRKVENWMKKEWMGRGKGEWWWRLWFQMAAAVRWNMKQSEESSREAKKIRRKAAENARKQKIAQQIRRESWGEKNGRRRGRRRSWKGNKQRDEAEQSHWARRNREHPQTVPIVVELVSAPIWCGYFGQKMLWLDPLRSTQLVSIVQSWGEAIYLDWAGNTRGQGASKSLPSLLAEREWLE